ncbi:MAG TPA: RNA polymerase sigma factor [Candidatus Dormibacteraeota bacterium]|nr:RNA polymerase sigma factor [Candidatus Dormibacteraeota bacterium]
MGSEADDELLARARAGDTVAFEAALAPLVGPAHRFACALLQDPQLAEDAVQEAAVRAWSRVSRLRAGSPLRPWFLGIVANQCREQRRGRWWRPLGLPDAAASPDDAVEERALRRAQLRQALLSLRRDERRVLVLRLYVELPWEEVAAVVGLTEAGARSRFYRALARLRGARDPQEVLT